jgi:hypothetical protein
MFNMRRPRGRRVDFLLQDAKADAFCFQLVDNVAEVGDGSGKPIEPCDDKDVPVADIAQRQGELLAVPCLPAAPLLGKDLCAPGGFELVKLNIQALPGAADAGVADCGHV